MIINNRIKELRKKLVHYSVDYFIVPSNDEFQNEYVPEYLNRLKYISGFSGSNGVALIGKENNLFFTDGRYLLQAKNELSDNFTIIDIADIIKKFPKGRIGFDPKLHTKANLSRYGIIDFVPCSSFIQLTRLAEKSEVFNYPLKYAGETSKSKRSKIIKYLEEKNLDALIMTDSANICWLLNIRAHDVPYNPILLSYLIFHINGKIELFSNAQEIQNVECYSFEQFYNKISQIVDKKVQVDVNTASIELLSKLSDPVVDQDPCLVLKACKNKTEIAQAKRAHIADGAALTKLLHWLEKNYHGKTEMDIADKLLEFRSMDKDFIYPSFKTIAGFAENGAIIHYCADEKTNKKIDNAGLLLLDSGGQYFGGTTDITRVIPIGKPSYQQKLDFTLVLKGHIALASAVFPRGTTGAELDCLARQFLWAHKKDYPHGTGHGIGNCLSVHEGPQRISKFSNIELKPGMILSNEPGFYKENEYGIRIENVILVKELKTGFLKFETISLAPIDTRLILFNLLTKQELKWLEDYHMQVYKKLSSHFNKKDNIWLKRKLGVFYGV